jgi:hypothetical protein
LTCGPTSNSEINVLQGYFHAPNVYKPVPNPSPDHFALEVGVNKNDGGSLYVKAAWDSNARVGECINEFGKRLLKNIHFFHAERLPGGSGSHGTTRELHFSGKNLAEVLFNLQANKPGQWQKFNELVREIIPSIHQMKVSTKSSNEIKVEYWVNQESVDHDDLAIELDESGTGAKHVLSLLYVVLTAEFPRTILIDEPNSFIHPGAARKLIAILKHDYPQHQYIIATHSPQIIRDTDPRTLLQVRWVEGGSSIEKLEASNLNDIKTCLEEVGAKLSDVFGADKILWVEGKTEEICFPLFLQGKISRSGINIIAVLHTGDFEKKRRNPKEVFELYEKLSKGNALIPPAICFVFDREDRTSDDREDLKQRSQGKIWFLPRRCYENYLLVPGVLAKYITQLDYLNSSEITERHIWDWLRSNGDIDRSPEGDPPREINPSDCQWLQQVNAPKLLNDLFQHFTKLRFTYDKLRDSPALTRCLLKDSSGNLQELKTFLEQILSCA